MLKPVVTGIMQLLFPRLCNGCGSDYITGTHLLCVKCFERVYPTGFTDLPGNPVEKMLWGRLPVKAATSTYFFAKDSLIQNLIHQFKYRNNKALGIYLGELMGSVFSASVRYSQPDALVPLPLFIDKEKKRGYNQSVLLCEGIATVLKVPVIDNAVKRIRHTSTQTHKTRMERWQNVEGVFYAPARDSLNGRHILLIDDVITTGATMEACGNAILEDIKNVEISVATLACAAF
ncbi:MAG: ComF family protein [Chitinophagaceae bacterium]|nr:ComF family protein [Chitinophagaceae bacterium]MCW5926375.1 ComF family protein [Chitinophagaceae bacterium]